MKLGATSFPTLVYKYHLLLVCPAIKLNLYVAHLLQPNQWSQIGKEGVLRSKNIAILSRGPKVFTFISNSLQTRHKQSQLLDLQCHVPMPPTGVEDATTSFIRPG